MDYTWVYDSLPLFGKRVVVILTTEKLDSEEIINYAYEVGAFLSIEDEEDLFYIKMPDEFDPEEWTADEIRDFWS